MASSIHGISNGEPVFMTTTVLRLAASTARARSSWAPGSFMSGRS
jgi:hypothetical protein